MCIVVIEGIVDLLVSSEANAPFLIFCTIRKWLGLSFLVLESASEAASRGNSL